jgi:hypothetical protein
VASQLVLLAAGLAWARAAGRADHAPA